MTELLGADSLAYISVENLKAAIGAGTGDGPGGGFCDACFTGNYPTATPTSAPVLFIRPDKPVEEYQAQFPGSDPDGHLTAMGI